MGVVKLPSGKTAKVPDGLTEQEVLELLFEKLPDGEDKTGIGDRLDTSGWGAAIGGTLGSIGGAIAGLPFGGVGAIPGSVAGGGAGAALGEGIEQWITGKGDLADVGRTGAEGAAWGLIPGVGGTAAKGAARLGARGLGQAGAALGTQAAAGGGLGAAGAAATGQDPRIGGAIGAGAGLLGANTGVGRKVVEGVGDVVKGTARTFGIGSVKGTLPEETAKGIKNIVTGEAKALFGRPTGKFQSAQGKLDIKRALISKAFDAFTSTYKRTPNKVEKEFIEDLAERSSREYDELLQAQTQYMTPEEVLDLFPQSADLPENAVRGRDYFAEGGLVTDAEGWAAEGKRYADANKGVGDISPRTILEFVPVIGDILGAEEIYRETQKDKPNWPLIGALGGASIIGLIPGVGDAAASAIKAGARAGLGGVKNGADRLITMYQKKFEGSGYTQEDIKDGVESWLAGNDRSQIPKALHGLVDEVENDMRKFEELGGNVKNIRSHSIEDQSRYAGYVKPKEGGPYGIEAEDIVVPNITDAETLSTVGHELGHARSPLGLSLDAKGILESELSASDDFYKKLDRYAGSKDVGAEDIYTDLDATTKRYLRNVKPSEKGLIMDKYGQYDIPEDQQLQTLSSESQKQFGQFLGRDKARDAAKRKKHIQDIMDENQISREKATKFYDDIFDFAQGGLIF